MFNKFVLGYGLKLKTAFCYPSIQWRTMNMTEIQMLKPALSQPVFPLSIMGVKVFFPGFALGDFAVLQGSSVLSLASLWCVKAQLPTQLGGLQSSVIFIDGGNTF